MLNWGLVAIAVLAGVTKGYSGKKTSNVTAHFYDAVYINVVRFGICALLGGVICLIWSGASSLKTTDGLWVALISGFAQGAFVTTWLLAVRTGAYTMLDAFLTAGILVPTVLCRFLYDEPIRPLQWLGFVILLGAVCMLCSYNNSIKQKLTPKRVGMLVLCSASSGVVDLTQRIMNHSYPEIPAAAYQFYAYLFAMLFLAVLMVLIRPKATKLVSVKKFGWHLVIMAVCLFINSYSKQYAAKGIPAVAMYSVCQGGGLILSAVMAAVFFHEPLKKQSVIGLLLIFAAMQLITFAG